MVLAAVGVAVASALSACSSTPAPTRSLTPAIPTGRGTASEKEALLTTNDLRAIPGAPTQIEVDSSKQPSGVYRDPDQIAPCGQRLEIPASSQTEIRQFGAATVDGFQLVVDVSVARATAFVTAWQKDTRPGCPPSRSLTNTGSTQTQVLVSSIPLPHLVDQETGALLRITNLGHTLDTYGLIFRSGGRIELDVVLCLQPLSTTFGNGFALKAEMKLNASLGIHSSSA
jgi:hypothetical protein